MRKYKIIFIICFIVVLGFMIYTFLPAVTSIPSTYNESRDGNRDLSQEELRVSSAGETYISDEVKEYNENVEHKDVIPNDNLLGDAGNSEVYATPIYGGDKVASRFASSE